jgi:hypothetical protein
MENIKSILSALWIATMLTYLLGDVLRIFAGDFTPGEMDGKPVGGNMFLIAGIMMLIPILMVLLSLLLPHQPNRWVNIVIAVIFFLFNAVGLPGYPGAYDRFLLAVSLVMNLMVVWFAWRWVGINPQIPRLGDDTNTVLQIRYEYINIQLEVT